MDNHFHRCHLHNQVPHHIEMCGEYTSWCHWRKANYTDPLSMGTNNNTCPYIWRIPYRCRPYTAVGSAHCKPLNCKCNCRCRSCGGKAGLNEYTCLCKRQSLHHCHLHNPCRHCKPANYSDTLIHLYTGRGRPPHCRCRWQHQTHLIGLCQSETCRRRVFHPTYLDMLQSRHKAFHSSQENLGRAHILPPCKNYTGNMCRIHQSHQNIQRLNHNGPITQNRSCRPCTWHGHRTGLADCSCCK